MHLELPADYSLPNNSLGVDAGNDALIQDYSMDINGVDRIIGNAVDMGAFEYSSSTREISDIEMGQATFATKVYPNPTRDELNILFEGEGKASIHANLYNTNGQLLQSKGQGTISNDVMKMNVSRLASGVYFLQVKVDDSIQIERVIIQK